MKVLISFSRKRDDLFFEGDLLANQIKKACRASTVVEEFARDVDIANFIAIDKKAVKTIRQATEYSIPTLLWMFFANIDEKVRLVALRKDGKHYIPKYKLDVINMMDGVVVPTLEARLLLRSYGVKIPVFIINGAINVERLDQIKDNSPDVFARYFRISEEKPFAFSVLNINSSQEIKELDLLAAAVPEYTFYTFVSSNGGLFDLVKIKALNGKTSKNLIITNVVPEDVYRYGLTKAKYFIDLGVDKMSLTTIYEAMYLEVPLIMNRQAIFKEIVDEKKAFVVHDYSGAAYVMRNNIPAESNVKNAKAYTKTVNEKTFTNAILALFKKIYTR